MWLCKGKGREKTSLVKDSWVVRSIASANRDIEEGKIMEHTAIVMD